MRPERAEKFFWLLFLISWIIAFSMILALSGCIDPTPQITVTPTWDPYPEPLPTDPTEEPSPYPGLTGLETESIFVPTIRR